MGYGENRYRDDDIWDCEMKNPKSKILNPQ